MGYRHIDLEERCAIARLRKAGATIREIAATLDRSPPTISREISRNSARAGEYKPVAADEKARARRWRGPRLDRDDLLREAARRRMEWGSSPPQVAGRLALEMGRPVISHESIYRFIAAQVKRTKDYDWRNFLPKRKAKRGRRSRKGRSSVAFIKSRRPLSERPAEAADRVEFGHWEAAIGRGGSSAGAYARSLTTRIMAATSSSPKPRAIASSNSARARRARGGDTPKSRAASSTSARSLASRRIGARAP